MMDLSQTLSNDAARVLIVSDCAAAAVVAREAVEASGGHIVAQVDLADAPTRLAEQISIDAILFECGRSSADQIDPLLDQMEALAGARFPVAVISTGIDQIDHYAARLGDDAVTLLCDPSVADRVVALRLADAGQSGILRDSATDHESLRLRRIADEVGRIAKALSNLSDPDATLRRSQSGVSDMMFGFRAEPLLADPADGPTASELRGAIRVRRMRDQFFGAALFADPAWDMLLDLFAARLERVQVAVSSLCIAAAVPPTTALRWIKTMTDEGLFERIADPDDGRRIFIRLSDPALENLNRYWAAVRRLSAVIV
jgi:CheY-like chemotaxis protein